MRVKWQYLMLEFVGASAAYLAPLGREGWEAVSMTQQGSTFTVLLKRPIE